MGVEIPANVWTTIDERDVEIFYDGMYSPEGFTILSNEIEIGGIEIDNIIENYPYYILLDRIRRIREEKLLKNSINAISNEILGRGLTDIQDVRTATNDIISKWRNTKNK
ncbi:Hypothetical protein ORPV_718 [Orpheovirus IHUMI-LCC2]|uniref:Uncharacterized protein n=1 Tax=Orpheovirus IHUMI-LCC2 TaxID=2023057 RepID=A0A2I2L4Z5_9VIRU|nr:Hypothetical protein ORPV_718 [Orpheovirus IHUMI-LCC2]SNW62622.1 Hypothetical protein ORPV_718 [Orpheovirus IHUMI-LCC2]